MRRLLNKLSDLYWWVRRRVWDPCNRIKIPTLSPDYHDKDEIYLHTCFSLLVRWVEVEKGLSWWTGGDPSLKSVQASEKSDYLFTMRRLYLWWKFERPRSVAALEKNYDIWLEMYLEDVDQRNLEELTKLRGHLWT